MRFSYLLFVFIISYSYQKKNQIAPPLVDGKIDEYEKLGVKTIRLEDNVNLYIY